MTACGVRVTQRPMVRTQPTSSVHPASGALQVTTQAAPPATAEQPEGSAS
jgi:hypothetical protein